MSDFLTGMAERSRARARRVCEDIGEARLRARLATAPEAVPLNLSTAGFDLIAEPKLASPSEGRLAAEGDDIENVVALAGRMAGAGAAAISVLTESHRFGGHIGHLGAVADSVALPVMRKDFLVDPIQVIEARASGASGVLLIARLTSTSALVEMTDLALSLGMFPLIELFSETDLDAASAVFDRPVLVGVNARDLTTLEVEPDRHRRLAALLPSHLPAVAESGVITASQISQVAAMGYRLALVGSGLVTAPDPAALVSAMIRAGRRARITEEVS